MMNNLKIVMGNQQESLELKDLINIPALNGYYTDGKGLIFSTKQSAYPKPLKQHLHKARGKKRYMRVKAGDKCHLSHRLIASIHIGRALNSDEVVNHKNGVTIDNTISNLEVLSHRENVSHAVQNGLYCSGEEWYKARGILKS